MGRPVYDRVEDLIAAVAGGRPWRLEPLNQHVDGVSGATFDQLVIGGAAGEGERRYFVKHIGRDLDWIMRVTGDAEHGTRPRALIVWSEGLLDRLPREIDHVLVGMAYAPRVGRLDQISRDVSPAMVPAGTGRVPLTQHRRFLEHLAAMHVAYWGFVDTFGLTTAEQRYRFAHPSMAAQEAAAGHHDPVPQLQPPGWVAAHALAGAATEAALAVAADPTPLALAMAEGPQTLIHGDWKFGNLGTLPDGRTVLLDWAWPGQGTPCADLAWYLGVNCDRLPESKEDAIAAYRDALERRGIDTSPWWQRQLDLAMLGAFVLLGWSKAGDPAEFGWWTETVLRTAGTLR
ncbi:MAG TPA: phosphotransferase [Micromonosporaceae bacterium]